MVQYNKQYGNRNINAECNRILWVDDEEMIPYIGSMILNKLGHYVQSANSGDKALELLQNEQFDLMITDYDMPKMNGLELIKKVHSIYENMHIAIASGNHDIEIYNETKIIKIIQKPFHKKDLEELIDDINNQLKSIR